jgi:hypothetical protein
VTIEEQRLAEMLHRVTPEPPRRITVEDVAIRMANEATRSARSRSARSGSARSGPVRPGSGRRGPGRRGSGGPGRDGERRGPWIPLLAAASVLAAVAASAGIAVALTGHHTSSTGPASGSTSAASRGTPSSIAQSVSTGPTQNSTQVNGKGMPPTPLAGGPWGAELITSDQLTPGTLVGSGNSLYAVTSSYLLRIDASSGVVTNQVSYPAAVPGQPPVIDGNTVWLVWSYGGGSVVLRGYDAKTLAQTGSITVSSSGSLAGTPAGIVAAAPGGNLYVAAGNSVAVVNPSSGSVIKRIAVSDGPAASVAVTPDGNTLYAGTDGRVTYELGEYDTATGQRVSAWDESSGVPANLVATSAGAWATTGIEMVEQVWFVPVSDLSSARPVSKAANGGSASVPTVADGAVWFGGQRSLVCLDPDSGQPLSSSAIPSDSGVAEQYGSVAFAAGHLYTIYLNSHAQQAGIAKITPPATC